MYIKVNSKRRLSTTITLNVFVKMKSKDLSKELVIRRKCDVEFIVKTRRKVIKIKERTWKTCWK